MKPLDDYIYRNQENFNSEEPLAGHFDRFEERLAQSGVRPLHGRNYYIIRIAAAVIAGLLITYAAFSELNFFSKSLDNYITATSNPELREAESYYSKQLDEYYSKLNDLKFSDKAQKQQIMDELSSMDKQAVTIKKDFIQNPDDERVQSAIINYYQVKIEFIDMMISRVQETGKTIL
ncbi:MAG TPA: hypothetical protein VK179_03180 [Bacteroidales bacterium]|nr:hypothetical protein [Bacteroidales bacterium]